MSHLQQTPTGCGSGRQPTKDKKIGPAANCCRADDFVCYLFRNVYFFTGFSVAFFVLSVEVEVVAGFTVASLFPAAFAGCAVVVEAGFAVVVAAGFVVVVVVAGVAVVVVAAGFAASCFVQQDLSLF